MTSHPNRSTWRSALPRPTGVEIRGVVGDNVSEFARRHNLSRTQVQAYLSETDSPHWALWELIMLREGRHPTLQLIER